MPVNTGSDFSKCLGNPFTLSASGTGNLSWHSGQTSPVVLATGNNFTTPVLPAGSHTYFVASSSCTMQGTRLPVKVLVHALPSATIAAPKTTICSGESLLLSGSGAHTYTWNQTSPGKTLTIAPLSQSVYSLTGLDTITSCSGTAAITIDVVSCTSLSGFFTEELQIYPNPVTDNTNVVIYSPADVKADLFTLTGKVLKCINLKAGRNEISCSELVPGIYMIQIRNEDSVLRVLKLFVQ